MIVKKINNIEPYLSNIAEKPKYNAVNVDNLTLLSIDGGYSFITYYMIRSFMMLGINIPTIIICNGDKNYQYLLTDLQKDYPLLKIYNIDIKNHLSGIPDSSFKHSFSIQEAIDNFIETDYILLCDNDILFCENIRDIILNEKYKVNNSAFYGWIEWENENDFIKKRLDYLIRKSYLPPKEEIKYKFNYDITTITDKNNNIYWCYNRIEPYCVFLNLKLLKEYCITDLQSYNIDTSFANKYFLDTMGMLFKNIYDKNLNYTLWNMWHYIYHIESATLKYKARTPDVYYNIMLESIERINNTIYRPDKVETKVLLPSK